MTAIAAAHRVHPEPLSGFVGALPPLPQHRPCSTMPACCVLTRPLHDSDHPSSGVVANPLRRLRLRPSLGFASQSSSMSSRSDNFESGAKSKGSLRTGTTISPTAAAAGAGPGSAGHAASSGSGKKAGAAAAAAAAASDHFSDEQIYQQPKSSAAPARKRSSVQRRILTGVAMGIVTIGVIFGGRWPFFLLMLIAQVLGQSEYYRMVIAKGHSPAVKTGLLCTATILCMTVLAPALADAVFPVGGTFICIYLLFRRREIATIADISTTFMGLFYAGYLPSFWVRLHGYRAVRGAVATPLSGILAKLWPSRILPMAPILELGPMLVFWTWLSVASADIGAFFVGRAFGRTRFSSISPKKTVEGAFAGFLCSASVSMLGAFLLRWPMWCLTGGLYGVAVGVVGLFGDLIASSFKRDVGWKDSGQLFPGHGGILDRADSYVLIAPLVYYFTTLVLPLLGMR